jgi:hypothetical protein
MRKLRGSVVNQFGKGLMLGVTFLALTSPELMPAQAEETQAPAKEAPSTRLKLIGEALVKYRLAEENGKKYPPMQTVEAAAKALEPYFTPTAEVKSIDQAFIEAETNEPYKLNTSLSEIVPADNRMVIAVYTGKPHPNGARLALFGPHLYPSGAFKCPLVALTAERWEKERQASNIPE